MPEKEIFFAQPPLEILRQWMQYGFWYDLKKQTQRFIKDAQLMAAMGHPGGGRTSISPRVLHWFHVLNMTFPDRTQLTRIFGTLINSHLTTFDDEIKSTGDIMTAATIDKKIIFVLRHNPACRDAVQSDSSAHDASGVIVDSVELADDWAAPACNASVNRPQQHVARASALYLRGGGPPLPGASDKQPTTPPAPLARTLPGCLLTRAECQPDATFVEVWDEHTGVELRVTFAQMASSMLAAMQWLRKRNFDDGDNCAILAHNSVEYISLSFGTMALGGVAIHLNWRQPESVTRQLLRQTKPAVVLASAPFLDAASRICCDMELAVASLEEVRAELAYLVPSDIDKARIRALDPTTNAVVFFTGGTTGTPKPIRHTHDSMLWLAHKLQTQVPNAHHAGTLCFTPFFHVMGFCANLIFNMHAGVRAFVLASHSTLLTASLMVKACSELEPSVLNTIPHIVEGLCHLLQAGKEDAITALGKLQLVTYGGAVLSAHCSSIMVAQGLKLIGTYGQTEVSGACTRFEA